MKNKMKIFGATKLGEKCQFFNLNALGWVLMDVLGQMNIKSIAGSQARCISGEQQLKVKSQRPNQENRSNKVKPRH